MSELEEEVRDLIKERYGGVPKFADKIGVNKQTIYSALNNGLCGSSMATMMPLVTELGLDPQWLTLGRVVPVAHCEEPCVYVPLYDRIPTGTPLETLKPRTTYPAPTKLHEVYPRAFMLRTSDESMNRILPFGCYALVTPDSEVTVPGAIYVVDVGVEDATMRRVNVLNNGLKLLPDSTDPTIKPLVLDYSDPACEPAVIIGQVVWYCAPEGWTSGS